jgi:sterol desaturase/sphingolipid hydroxylase (fatty acid hydroxylase superfamily)
VKTEEEYVQNNKGFYKLVAVALLSLALPLFLAINDPSNWIFFLTILVSWVVLIGIYSLNVFDLFDEYWKRKVIENKFKKK